MSLENKSFRSRFGRFFWLFLLATCLGALIGYSFVFGSEPAWIGIGVYFIINISSTTAAVFLYNKALETEKKNNISITPFRNIFLPWPKAAIWLSVLFLVELLVEIPLFVYAISPCSGLDVIRKINGCLNHIPHQRSVQNIAFSKDGRTFATSDLNGSVHIWSYPGLALVNDLGNGWPYNAKSSLSSNGEMVAICGHRGAISVIETKTGKVLHTLIQNNDDTCDLTFTPDDRSIISISESELQIWDAASGKLVNSIAQDNLDLEITPDGSLLAAGSRDGIINIRRVSDLTIFATIPQPNSLAMAFSRDGKYLFAVELDFKNSDNASQSTDSIVNVWNNAFQSTNSIINVWNIETGKLEHTTTLQNILIDHISSSSTSNGFAVGSRASLFSMYLFSKPCSYFWPAIDAKMPMNIRVPDGVDSMAFSPLDGKILIGSYNDIYIWQIP